MKKGFTLIEVLAVLIIMSLLIIIAIPAYTGVYSTIKRNNLQSKISEIEVAALKYGSLIKDNIKNANNSCIDITVRDLIEDGLLMSENVATSVMYNPTDNLALDGKIRICYCPSIFDLAAYYTVNFDQYKVYHAGDVVVYNNKLYRCTMTYNNRSGINGTAVVNKKSKRYFEEIEC